MGGLGLPAWGDGGVHGERGRLGWGLEMGWHVVVLGSVRAGWGGCR